MDYNGYVIERVTAALLDEKRKLGQREAMLSAMRHRRSARELIGGALIKLGRFVERGAVAQKPVPSVP